MIITRTPLRFSFLGGGTDYPEYFREHTGQTLGASINQYTNVIVNRLLKLFDHTIRVGYSKTELVKDIDEIEHPAVRECLRFLSIRGGVEVQVVTDLPARTGLGSSSSFTVGLLHALHAFKGEMVSLQQLAREAVYVEQEMIKERVGVQDQYTCAHGGLLHLRFAKDGDVKAAPIPLAAARFQELQSHLMLFYTGVRRLAHEVLEEQIERTKQGEITRDLGYLNELVDRGIEVLSGNGPVAAFGDLLHEAWMIKRQLSGKISSSSIDRLYDTARQAGAVGGKLLGAGGGGFFLLLAEPDKQEAVRSALAPLTQVDFAFESTGSTLLYYNEN